MELAQFALLSGLTDEQRNYLAQHMQVRQYHKHTQIITEGDPAHCLYFLLSGKVKVYLDDDEGKEILMNTHGEGEVFGELSLIQGSNRTASVMTLEESRIAQLSAADFKAALKEMPEFALALMQDLAARLGNATETIRQLGLMDVYGRIAVTLLNLSEEEGGVRIVRDRLTQQELATRVGASREMVARIFKDLRLGGYIETDSGHIVLKKPLPHKW
jgi:CRP/FNR family cyclic AMP-dependent transcriptional regulator